MVGKFIRLSAGIAVVGFLLALLGELTAEEAFKHSVTAWYWGGVYTLWFSLK